MKETKAPMFRVVEAFKRLIFTLNNAIIAAKQFDKDYNKLRHTLLKKLKENK